jgi:hypothetical protein
VASVVTGSLLVLAATLSAPGLRTWWRALRAPRPPEPAG